MKTTHRAADRPRLASLSGLGFGDCGKGLFTDFLCRDWAAGAVVRFNGGAQAGHNVVLADGRQHTFSQFCAGMLVPGVLGVLASPVVIHPSALQVEHAALQALGVDDALARLRIDARCRINTPFHQAAGRLRELMRGAAAHGSCGVGVGETVRDSLAAPDGVLRYGDLVHRGPALARAEAIRQRLWSEFAHAQPGPGADDAALAAWRDELRLLGDARIAVRWLDGLAGLLHACPPRSTGEIGRELLGRGRAVIFEGAQGLLLDEWHGFHPHTTWSSTGPAAALKVAHEFGLCGASGVEREMRHFGVLRTYLTRHGAGPLPTHDGALDQSLAEPHNADDGWQGPFRRGHPDAVLLRYAAQAAGRLDGLLLSHLDAVERPHGGLRWCIGYRLAPHAKNRATPDLPDEALCERDAQGALLRLRPGAPGDLRQQEALGRLLARARPIYHTDILRSADEAVRCIADAAGCPVLHGSFGPRAADVRDLRALGGDV